MSSILRIAVVVITASACLSMAGGISGAEDPLVGKTYTEASAVVSGLGGTPKIATVVGGRLATDDCIVASWHKSSSLDSAGSRQTNVYLINLNCSGPTASALPSDPTAS